MPSQVLGKVSVTPKGDYNSATTYYALDIVGFEGGSYLAMKEVTGIEPSNDQVNWMQLSGPGLPGEQGPQGVPGAAAGFGEATATVDDTSGTPSVDVQTSGPDTAKVFTFAFSGLKGTKGDTGDKGDTGNPGPVGPQGVSVVTAHIQENGHLVLTLSEGEPIDAGNATGPIGPQGIQGEAGESVDSIQRTSGTGAPGTTDTYTMYSTDGSEIGTFTVYNGQNGTGAGDFMADGSVPMTGNLDMNGNRVTEVGTPTADTDAANKAYVDEALEGVTITTDATPTEDSTNPVQSGGVFDALSNKQDTLSGTEDQIVGFNASGEAAAVPMPSAADVGADPAGTAEAEVAEHNSSGDAHSALFAEKQDKITGQQGQLVGFDSNGNPVAQTAPDTGVTTFNGRTGAVTPQAGDYTAEMVGAVSEADVGVANGVAELDSTGKVPVSQLPSMDYIPTSEKGANSGVATLDASGKLTAAQKPTYTASEVGALPTQTGTQGQVLGFTSDNVVGPMDAPSGLPSGGSDGQMLYQSSSGPKWDDKPIMYVTATYSSGQTYATDKSASEIMQAYNLGYSVFLVFETATAQSIARLSSVDTSLNTATFYVMRSGRKTVFTVTNNSATLSDEITESKSKTITLTATGWTGSAAPFSQQVSCSIVAADTAVVAVDVDTPGTDADADAEAINAWALCTQRNPTQGAGTLTFYCTEKPTINIPVKVGVA